MIKNIFKLEINKTIKFLIFVNLLVVAADGFLAPVFAIFVTQKIAPTEIKVVGFAVAIYWLIKSIIQFPLARYLDKNRGEKDDILSLILGAFLLTAAPLLYIFAQTKFELYLIQGVFALGAALYVVPWYSIFTRHVDQFRIGFEWAVNSSALGFGLVLASTASGLLADWAGFNFVFIAASFLNLMVASALIIFYKHLLKDDRLLKTFPEQPSSAP